MAALEERAPQAERALGYVELYGAYTETEARFRVDRLLALWDRLDADDRQAFCFDPAVDRLGRTTSTTSTSRRSSSTPGCAPRPARSTMAEPRRPRPQRPSSRPTATWPPSTSRTP